MKKIRIILSVAAILFAVGASFASRIAPSMTGYEFIPAGGGEPEQCIQRTVDCDVSGSNPCTLNTHDVRRDNTVTHCGSSLKKP